MESELFIDLWEDVNTKSPYKEKTEMVKNHNSAPLKMDGDSVLFIVLWDENDFI